MLEICKFFLLSSSFFGDFVLIYVHEFINLPPPLQLNHIRHSYLPMLLLYNHLVQYYRFETANFGTNGQRFMPGIPANI